MAVRSAIGAPASATNASFTHEYELKDYLDSAWVMRPLELLKTCGQTVLLFEKPDLTKLDGIFDAFYTAKPDGLGGMDLSVCRTIAEAMEESYGTTAADPDGAMFQFKLPARGQ